MPDSPLVETIVTKPCFLHIHMSVHGIIMIQVGVLEPFSCDKETIATIARYSSSDSKFTNPGFSIVLSHEETDWIVPPDETKVTVKRIIFFEIGVVPFIDRSVGSELLVDLLEEGGFAKEIIGT